MQTREIRPRLHTRRPLVNHHNSHLTLETLSKINQTEIGKPNWIQLWNVWHEIWAVKWCKLHCTQIAIHFQLVRILRNLTTTVWGCNIKSRPNISIELVLPAKNLFFSIHFFPLSNYKDRRTLSHVTKEHPNERRFFFFIISVFFVMLCFVWFYFVFILLLLLLMLLRFLFQGYDQRWTRDFLATIDTPPSLSLSLCLSLHFSHFFFLVVLVEA